MRRIATAAGACLLVGGLLHAWSPDAEAAEPAAFTGTATSAGIRMTIIVPRFLVAETLADAGLTVTQATLSPLGGQGYASSLYPGDTAVAQQAVGLLKLPPPPAYPAEVSASHPLEPHAEAAFPGQEMTAGADARQAEGRANAGRPGSSSSTSVARIEALPDGSVVARAESVVEGLTFADGLHIGRVVSVVTVTRKPGAAEPVVEKVTTVTGAEVAGTPVEIGPDGLELGDTTVRRVAGEAFPGGASTDALEVRTTSVAVPGAPQATLVYRIGGAVAAITGDSAAARPLAPTPTEPSTSPPGTASAAGPALPNLTGSQALAVPPTVAGPMDPSGAFATPAAASAPTLDLPGGLGVLYLVLLLAGVAAFAASSILRRTGVLRSWT